MPRRLLDLADAAVRDQRRGRRRRDRHGERRADPARCDGYRQITTQLASALVKVNCPIVNASVALGAAIAADPNVAANVKAALTKAGPSGALASDICAAAGFGPTATSAPAAAIELMAAPAVAAIVAFLTGAGGGVATAPWAMAMLHGEQIVAGVYADLPAICSATDPLIDALGDAYPNSIELSRLAAVADAICAAADRPDTPARSGGSRHRGDRRD